ncbi:WG repeat-containing protein [Algoriphagus litoralis]|uniref:WG repeat-containing protein n=1 Tax=Algoriphagus litoralis TaxID=2202829 RepID=UPI000DBAC33A|nr:WG repeat-containing protein [Algoriphagus litoralis]
MVSHLLRILLFSFALLALAPSLSAQTWEVYDLQGNLKSLAIYDRIKVLSETVIVGKNEQGLAMLSRELNPLVDLKGDEVFQYLAPWILVKGPNGIGAFHEYGLQALPLEYDEINTYFNFLLGRKGSDFWYFDKGNGKTTALGKWDSLKFSKNGILIGQKNGGYFLPLSKDPERRFDLIEENEGSYLLAKESTGFGILNFEGNYVMQPILSQLEHTTGDYFYGFDENQYLLIKGDFIKSDVSYNSYHKITKEGDLLLEFIHGKLRRVMEEDGILLDAVGMESVKVVGKKQYNVAFRDSTIGLLGENGWQVKPTVGIDWINPGAEGLFPAGKNGKSGFVNSEGKWVIEPNYAKVENFNETIASFRNSPKWGLIGTDGKIISEAKWDEIKKFSAGMAVAKAEGKYFLLNKNGQVINEEGLDQICRLKEGYFLVEKGGKRGLWNTSGEVILPLEFDNIQVEKSDFFIVTKDGSTGALNEKAEAIFPINYKEIVADWAGNQILVKELYKPVVIQLEEPTTGKRKKGA